MLVNEWASEASAPGSRVSPRSCGESANRSMCAETRGRRGAAAWVRAWARPMLSELCATALLVALGVGSCVGVGGAERPLAHVAQAFGCVVVGCAVAFGPASGAHMNPAVTLAAALGGALAPAPAAAYALAQLAGAVLGFAALQGALHVPPGVGVTHPAAGVGAGAAVCIEAALTALLVLACCSLWAEARPDPAAPLKLGLVVAGLVYSGGPATGASLNPARSFAPALLHGDWEHQWVYWAGPLGGAALAALLHRFALRARRATGAGGEDAAEELPLDDKP